MAASSACVLIVDDNAGVRHALRDFLENRGIRVCDEAGDGVEAIEKATEHNPALILMDCSMPRLNGLAAASIIRPKMPDIKIVLFTMFDGSVGQALSKHSGIDLVVSKTAGTPALIRALRGLLPNTAKFQLAWIL